MHLPKLQKPLVVIVGPTAVGKTDFSIQLAKEINGEIISSDSRLFYKGMDRGTAKPTLKERRGIPHHLIDIANPDEILSLAVFGAWLIFKRKPSELFRISTRREKFLFWLAEPDNISAVYWRDGRFLK